MWISRIWLLCHREQLNDDPVAFAIRDKVSIALGGIMALSFLAGWLPLANDPCLRRYSITRSPASCCLAAWRRRSTGASGFRFRSSSRSGWQCCWPTWWACRPGFYFYRRYVFPGSRTPVAQQVLIFLAVNLAGALIVLAFTFLFLKLQSGFWIFAFHQGRSGTRVCDRHWRRGELRWPQDTHLRHTAGTGRAGHIWPGRPLANFISDERTSSSIQAHHAER